MLKCKDCSYMTYNEDGFLCCMADPRWPAPCEEEDEEEEKEDYE